MVFSVTISAPMAATSSAIFSASGALLATYVEWIAWFPGCVPKISEINVNLTLICFIFPFSFPLHHTALLCYAASHPFSFVPLPLNAIPSQIMNHSALCRRLSLLSSHLNSSAHLCYSSPCRCSATHCRSCPSQFSAILCLGRSCHVYAAATPFRSTPLLALAYLCSSFSCRLLAFPYIALSLQPHAIPPLFLTILCSSASIQLFATSVLINAMAVQI